MIIFRLFITFFGIGLFTIGGGLASIPLLRDAVELNSWMSMQQFTDMIAISESTPGAIGINMATYVGYTTAGVAGAIFATLGIVFPSLIIIIVIAHFFMRFSEQPLIKSALNGVRPAVTGLIAATGFELSKTAMNYTNIKHIVLFFSILFLAFRFKFHPAVYIFFAAICGVILKL